MPGRKLRLTDFTGVIAFLNQTLAAGLHLLPVGWLHPLHSTAAGVMEFFRILVQDVGPFGVAVTAASRIFLGGGVFRAHYAGRIINFVSVHDIEHIDIILQPRIFHGLSLIHI